MLSLYRRHRPLLLLITLAACTVMRDATDEHDTTALMRAAQAGDAAGVERELASGARVNQTVRGYSAVRELLAAGANPNTRDGTGSSLLAQAVYRQDLESARALLAAGAIMDRLTVGEIPLLQRAAQVGNLELVELLLTTGASATLPGTATHAAASGQVEVLRTVGAAGADLRERRDQPLRSAAGGDAVSLRARPALRSSAPPSARSSRISPRAPPRCPGRRPRPRG